MAPLVFVINHNLEQLGQLFGSHPLVLQNVEFPLGQLLEEPVLVELM